MTKSTKGYHIKRVPKNRRLVIDLLEIGAKKHHDIVDGDPFARFLKTFHDYIEMEFGLEEFKL